MTKRKSKVNRERAARSLQASVGLHPQDAAALKDYGDFRRVRAEFHINGAQWAKMSKRTKAAICNMMKLAYAQEVLGPGAVLKSITAEPKGSRVLVLAQWGDKFFVLNVDGKPCTLTFEDISKHWLVQANTLLADSGTKGGSAT
jgi:hypothetical protein